LQKTVVESVAGADAAPYQGGREERKQQGQVAIIDSCGLRTACACDRCLDVRNDKYVICGKIGCRECDFSVIAAQSRVRANGRKSGGRSELHNYKLVTTSFGGEC
jgi:hypothetical protein